MLFNYFYYYYLSLHILILIIDSILIPSGWGLTEFGGQKPNVPKKVHLNVINPNDCKKYYNITSKDMCTYTPGKDSCQVKKKTIFLIA